MNINWENFLSKKDLKRNKWSVEEWSKLYAQNIDDLYIRKMSTDELHKGLWLEKYGLVEPNFEEE